MAALPSFAAGDLPYTSAPEPAKEEVVKEETPFTRLGKTLGYDLSPLADIYSQEAQAKGKVLQAQQEQKMAEVEGKAKAQGQYAAGMHEAYRKAEPTLMSAPPKFNVTKDTEEGLTGMAALMTIGGMIIGSKGMTSGVNAMNAMTGVMKGYQEGNQARIDFETKKYEKAMDEWKTTVQQTRDSLARYEKLAQVDLNKATAEAARDAMAKGQNVIAAQIQQEGISAVRAKADQLLQQTINSKLTPVIDSQTGQSTFATVAQINANPDRYQPVPKTGQSALIAGRADNVKEAVTQVAADVYNISKFAPKNSVLGAFSGMTGQEGENLLSSLRNTFARKVTNSDNRMLQQLIAGLETNLSMALGGGYASSGAKNRIDQYKAQIPKAGDDGYVVATFLGRVRQEMNVLDENFDSKPGATPAMIDKVHQANRLINQSIPFTVDDVISARQSKSPPPRAGGITPSSLAQSIKEPAASQGKSKVLPGEVVHQDAQGNKAVQRNGTWVEVED